MLSPQVVTDIHNIADTVGAIISLPLLGAMVVGVRFIDGIKHAVEETTRALTSYVDRSDKQHTDHETRLREAEGKVEVLWDGHERRKSRASD